MTGTRLPHCRREAVHALNLAGTWPQLTFWQRDPNMDIMQNPVVPPCRQNNSLAGSSSLLTETSPFIVQDSYDMRVSKHLYFFRIHPIQNLRKCTRERISMLISSGIGHHHKNIQDTNTSTKFRFINAQYCTSDLQILDLVLFLSSIMEYLGLVLFKASSGRLNRSSSYLNVHSKSVLPHIFRSETSSLHYFGFGLTRSSAPRTYLLCLMEAETLITEILR
ncbi:hypothetical protein EJ08DRAFT_649175 [Tothia fuscella]|uniref:Uncharacterized protein n=1 Tax=Tothia fuscella TaxID=1048955 RepID=A0A9P4NTT6_9PEZI|nr:hypothetical protein EJ08DRAFT_649175 [Tothia fuscella]